MAVSVTKKSKLSKKGKEKEFRVFTTMLFKFLCRIPIAFVFIVVLFLWCSSITVISGRFIHVCVSSRKLHNLYCLSAGTQPNFEIPIPTVNNISSSFSLNGDGKEVVKDFRDEQIKLDVPNTINTSSTDISVKGDVKEVVNVVPDNSVIGDYKEEIVENVKDTQIKLEVRDTNMRNTSVVVNDVVYVSRKDPVTIIQNSIDRDETGGELEVALKAIEEHLQIQRSWSWSSNKNHDTCEGRGIYVYDLPTKFNKDLVAQCHDMVPWTDFCKYFHNDALGEPIPDLGTGWYRTHQYSLEPIFHSRVSKHPCRVYNENEAKLFFVPFYGGLDILRWHFKNVTNDVKDSLSLELIKWLEAQRAWSKNLGKDHVFVLGKISWDFRRYSDSSWGTKFLELKQMQNPIKLLIERQPWHENDIGIPHPTFFHPHLDNDISSWQWKMIRSYRKSLVSFAGAARPDAPENIRSILIKQCTSFDVVKCHHLDCNMNGCDQPESVIQLFMESEFCLQPPGDSPTRKSVFDSLIAGCIPVFFDPFTAYYQYPWHLPEDHGRYSVSIDKEELRKMKINVVEMLMKISPKKRDEMRSFIIYELLPGLVYGDSNSQLDKFQDAFSITMNNLLERVKHL